MFDFGNRTEHSSMRRPDRFTRKPEITQNISKPSSDGIMGHLDKIQQFVNAVERTAPYIEEYGPFIKNLPQMYRMIKAFKSLETEEQDSSASDGESQKAETTNKGEEEIHEAVEDEQNIPKDGTSKPRLFI
ncbi:VrrA/YqfQ family protein [Aciduricibacillus chroicocephali]|uniref:VrrA/YqfQ family protein n=1 Tax=Aciduricibacillus chroicocephali TaxID=3054939 RepID=A0ABY9KYS8_9BACI|nr:VrrA/YqfQ family protein [Bacillaceae bacterium 44XB]